MKKDYKTPTIETIIMESCGSFLETSADMGGDNAQWGNIMYSSPRIWEKE